MNKYHAAHRSVSVTGRVDFELGFGGATFSRENAQALVDGMNNSDGPWGLYLVVPAPFAGEI